MSTWRLESRLARSSTRFKEEEEVYSKQGPNTLQALLAMNEVETLG